MRSTSSTNMANMTQSMYSTSSGTRGPHGAEHQNFPSNHQRRSSEREMNGGAKRATSVHALDQSAEIDGKYTILHITYSNSKSDVVHEIFQHYVAPPYGFYGHY